MAQQPEAVADILKRSQSQQGRTCPRCGRERAFVVNSAGRTVPLLAPCMHCYQGGPAEPAAEPHQAAEGKPIGHILRSIPPSFRDAHISDFGMTEELVAFANAARPGFFTLIGPCGSGKTRACYAMRIHAAVDGRPCTMHHCPTLLAQMTSGRNGASTATELGKRESLLILDDLGAESPPPWQLALLLIILHRREEWRFPTFLTTNLDLQALSRLSERLASRIAGGIVLELDGRDHRLPDPAAGQLPF